MVLQSNSRRHQMRTERAAGTDPSYRSNLGAAALIMTIAAVLIVTAALVVAHLAAPSIVEHSSLIPGLTSPDPVKWPD